MFPTTATTDEDEDDVVEFGRSPSAAHTNIIFADEGKGQRGESSSYRFSTTLPRNWNARIFIRAREAAKITDDAHDVFNGRGHGYG